MKKLFCLALVSFLLVTFIACIKDKTSDTTLAEDVATLQAFFAKNAPQTVHCFT